MTTCETLDALFSQAKATAGEIAEASRARTIKVRGQDVPLSDFDPVYVKDEVASLTTQLEVAMKANASLRGLLRMAWRERDMMAARLTEVIRERDRLALQAHTAGPPEDIAAPIAKAIAAHQDKGQR